MNRFSRTRRLIFSMIGILPLILSLTNISPALADGARSDISIKISVDRHVVRLGQNVTFTVKATNLGPDPAPFVDIVHNFPGQFRLVSLTCDLGTSADTPNCEYSLIEPGQTLVSTLVVTPNPDARPHRRELVVTANYQFENIDTIDPNSTNNQSSVEVLWAGRLR